MTDPKFAEKIPGLGRWYVHPTTGERWPSVTNVLDVAVAKPALKPWAVKITAEKALAEMPRLAASTFVPLCKPKRVADGCGKCRTCVMREIKSENTVVSETASDLGTRIHDWAQAKVIGKPIPDDPDVAPFGKQLLRFFAEFGVDFDRDIEAAEATVVNRTVGYAGTGDLWVRLRLDGWKTRRLCLIDYKSSSTRPVDSVYPEMAMQLAALAHGEKLLLDDGTEVPAPKGIKHAFILNLRADDYALIPMPLAGTLADAFAGFQGALADANFIYAQHGAKPVTATPLQPERKAS